MSVTETPEWECSEDAPERVVPRVPMIPRGPDLPRVLYEGPFTVSPNPLHGTPARVHRTRAARSGALDAEENGNDGRQRITKGRTR